MQLRKLESYLEEALRASSFNNAHFGKNTELIKNETKLYRDTWVSHPIEMALEIVREEIEKRSSYNKRR